MVKLSENVTDSATGVLAPYGLLSPAVKVIEDDDPHWENGFEYDTLGCAGTTKIQSICVSASASVTTGASAEYRKYRPFAVQATFACSTRSRTPAEVKALATQELDIVLQKAIEKEFLDGVLAQAEAAAASESANRYLSDSEVTSLSATAVKPRLGLALLEGAIASSGNGAQGVIHAPRNAAAILLLEKDGDVLRTSLDTPVVAGGGYVLDSEDTTVTLYGTGAITVRLGPVVVIPDQAPQAVDRAVNTTTYTAERVVAVTWDSCAHFSVPIDLSLDY